MSTKKEKTLEEQNLSANTKRILTIIYHDFFCNQKGKEELDKILKENDIKKEQEQREMYSYEKIFSNNNQNKSNTKNNEKQINTQIIQYKENPLKKIIIKIKQIFRKNRN